MPALGDVDILSSAIGVLTNPNKLQKTFKSVNHSKITATTITKYIEYLEDAFLIEEAARYDIKGKSYKKIIITSDTPKPCYTDEGILIMNVYDFLLNPELMDL